MDEIKTADGIKVFCAHTSIELIAKLKPNAKNPNQHPRQQIKLLAKVIQANGWRNTIVVSSLSGLIVKGHGRYEAALMLGVTEVPVDVQRYDTAEQEWQDMLTDNRIAELAEMDQEVLAEIIKELTKAQTDLDLTGYDKDAVQRLLGTSKEELENVLKVQRTKILWGRFKVFHCCVRNQVFCADKFSWLLSFGVEKGGLPERKRTKECTLFVDSGMLTMAAEIGPKAVERQDEVIEYAEKCEADWVTMMDIPLVPGILSSLGFTKADAYKIMYRNAEKFAAHPTKVRKVYVCQGQTLADYRSNAKELANYVQTGDVIAIGSIKDKAEDVTIISAIVAAVHAQFPQNDIHLFGVTNAAAVRAAVQYGATSCDSSTAAGTVGRAELLFCRKEGNEYRLKHERIADFMNEPNLSIGGKLWLSLTAFSMGQVEAALAMNMAMDEAAILFNGGFVERPLENQIEQPKE